MFLQYLQLSWYLISSNKNTIKKIKNTKHSSKRIFLIVIINSLVLSAVFFLALAVKPALIGPNAIGTTIFLWPGWINVTINIIKNASEFIFMFYGWVLALWLWAYIFREKSNYKNMTVLMMYFFSLYVIYFSLNIFMPLFCGGNATITNLIQLLLKIFFVVFFVRNLKLFFEWNMWKSLIIFLLSYIFFIIIILTIWRIIWEMLSYYITFLNY